MNLCVDCSHHVVVASLDRCDNPRVRMMPDGHGPSCAFQRVHGTIQCGPDATEWRERG